MRGWRDEEESTKGMKRNSEREGKFTGDVAPEAKWKKNPSNSKNLKGGKMICVKCG